MAGNKPIKVRVAPMHWGVLLLLTGCATSGVDVSKYPDAAVKNAGSVILDPNDIALGEDYRNQGIVLGHSCVNQADAERMLRLEAAKRFANRVVRFQCGQSYTMGCAVEYRCKGKAISVPDDKPTEVSLDETPP